MNTSSFPIQLSNFSLRLLTPTWESPSGWTPRALCVRRRSQTLSILCAGAMNAAGMMHVEIRGEFAMKTEINPGFQLVYQLPAHLRENKLCTHLRTVNAPIKTQLYGMLVNTIHLFTQLLIFHLHSQSNRRQLPKWFDSPYRHRQEKNFFWLNEKVSHQIWTHHSL